MKTEPNKISLKCETSNANDFNYTLEHDANAEQTNYSIKKVRSMKIETSQTQLRNNSCRQRGRVVKAPD